MEATKTAGAESEALNSNALLVQMEKQYVAVKEDRDTLFKAKQTLAKDLETMQEEIAALKTEVTGMAGVKVSLESQSAALTSKLTSVSDQLRDMTERSDRNATENDLLREEISKLQNSNAALSAQLNTAKVSASVNTANTLKFECERYKAECQALTEHSAFLEGEVKSLRSKSAIALSEHQQKVLDLESKLHTSNDLTFRLQSDANASLSRIDNFKELVSALQAKVVERDSDITILTSRCESESSDHANLRSLYQHKYELLEGRLKESEEHLKELRLEAAASVMSAERERLEYDTNLATLQAKVAEQTKLIERKSTSRSNHALNLIPDSAEAGVKMTEVYDSLMEKEEELRHEKSERQKSEMTLSRLVKEMEAKAPIIARRQRDYIALEKRFQTVKGDHEEALEECNYLRERLSQAESEAHDAKVANESTRRENIALAQQVQSLLIAQIGGDNVNNGADVSDFTNVQELQAQNQQLLQKLFKAEAELDASREKNESKIVEANSVLADYGRLKEERRVQEEHVQGIVQQRDMYRALLTKQDAASLAIDNDVSIEAKLDEATVKLGEQERENIALSSQIDRLNVHCETLSSANEKLSSNLLEKSTGLAKCAATLSYAENKLHQLEEDMKEKNNRFAKLEARNAVLSRENEQLHSQSQHLQGQISGLNSEILSLRSSTQTLNAAKLALESNNSRMCGEIKVLQEQQAQSATLFTSLQRIELHMQGDAKKKVEHLEQMVENLQKELAGSVSQSKHEETQKLLSVREIEVAKFQKELSVIKGDKEKLELELSAKNKPAVTGHEQDAAEQLIDVKIKLSDVQKHLQTYKSMAKDFEEVAKKLEADKESANTEFASKLAEATATIESQRSALSTLASSFDDEKAKLLEKITGNDMEIAELKSSLAQLEATKKTDEENLDSLRGKILALRSDVASMTSNYERELNLHNQCRIELNQINRKYQELQTTEGVSHESLNKLKIELTESIDSHSAEVARLTAQLEEKQAEILELRGSTGTLNTKISSLVEKLANHAAPTEGDDTTSELQSVVQFLENERRILDAELAGLRGKLERESINFRVLQRALDDARAELAAQKPLRALSQSETSASSSVELLTESNSHLRQVNIDLDAKIKDLESKLIATESKVAPLEEQVQEWVVKGSGFDMEIDGLKQEAAAWKSRTKEIISKFSQIDPEEHERLQNTLKDVKAELEDTKVAKEGFEKASSQAKLLLAKMNKDMSNLKTSLSAANGNLLKSQKEHKEALAKLAEVSAKSGDKEELESVKRELKSVETRCERLQTFMRNLKQSNEKLKEEKENLVREKQILSNEKKVLSKEKDHQRSIVDKLKATLKQKEADIAKKEAVTSATSLVLNVAPSSTSNISNSKEAGESVSDLMEPPTPAPTPVTTPTPPAEATSVTLDAIMENNAALQIPTSGFKFAAGSRKKDDDKSEAGAVVDEEKRPTAKVEEVSAESALRARLLKKKRKLAGELKAHAEQLATVQEGVASSKVGTNLGGKEDTQTPVAKRERLNESIVTKPQGEEEKSVVHDVISSPGEKAAAPFQTGSKSPFISNLKPPSSDAVVGEFIFGTSTNIQLPVPSGGALRPPLTTPLFGSGSSPGVNPFAVVAPKKNKPPTVTGGDKDTSVDTPVENSVQIVNDNKAPNAADAVGDVNETS
mmetsp:Transcript_7766/g.11469  ORF Transcript_7766/g.11469 Transcript_7766/m.11469 type:complete len:1665 (+) Transcript_7766:128-5122(+)|eukprot:CAMPEP_0196824130 /NCGR_PEP_ID=MMETSP1362-20130617/90551_1 /TAXON_ID=163516 /ORGANISM="Leptocylindrus danicus, Strain CCMP1856" /LENGTH=1664 /DNA_ID=CAMNT_0042204281 /DNA_START=62 /DNA_END=5056 /DNA_ORIENTATION=-